ncbi:hypothetical protein J19TS2_43150 [Cohnella xylanilytica]|nr:hypothetical protein J19TS2_43150 [Cohnella xylanilytica]
MQRLTILGLPLENLAGYNLRELNTNSRRRIDMYPAKPDVKEIIKGSGFKKIVKANDSLRAQLQAAK